MMSLLLNAASSIVFSRLRGLVLAAFVLRALNRGLTGELYVFPGTASICESLEGCSMLHWR